MKRRLTTHALVAGALLTAIGGCGNRREGAEDPGVPWAAVCYNCHGNPANGNPAPLPVRWKATAEYDPHQAHLEASPDWRAAIACEECHTVPLGTNVTGHLDPFPAEMVWGELAIAGDIEPMITASVAATDMAPASPAKCSSTYCHGVTLYGGTTELTWSDAETVECGSCHGVPPIGDRHPAVPDTNCGPCHDWEGLTPKDPSTHINGNIDVSGDCGSCHDLPPDLGAHMAHFGVQLSEPIVAYGDLRNVEEIYPDGVPYYAFGCGNCHPLDPSKHLDTVVQVELYDPTAPAGSIKALNPATASYENGTCSDVYCHSSGQANAEFVDSPAWEGGTLPAAKCDSCHSNPPAYASGGVGTATANSHVVLADDGFEYGHFGGLPGAWHGSYHGEQGAAPVTCQTCHYDTLALDNTGPGGFYYLDTTGSYDLGGTLGYACSNCHTGDAGAPATGTGAIRTALHVNGTRNVTFDPRTEIPASVTGLPAERPNYPYWLVLSVPTAWLPTNAVLEGLTWSSHLGDATYEPSTQTCSNVPCHLGQSFGTGDPAYEPLRWGLVPVGTTTCEACHQL